MKLRRTLAAATAAATLFVASPAVAQAQTAPEPLESVLREIRNVAGWEAQNLILVPAALSSINVVLSILQAIYAGV